MVIETWAEEVEIEDVMETLCRGGKVEVVEVKVDIVINEVRLMKFVICAL